MAMHGLVSGVAAVLLVAAGGLTGPAWGNEATEERLAQATAQEMAGIDAEKVKQLDAALSGFQRPGSTQRLPRLLK
jgi:hypothetical protein